MGTPLLALSAKHIFEIDSLNFQKLKRRTEVNLPEIKRFGSMSSTQFTGRLRGSMTISGLLFPEEFNDRAEYEALRKTQSAGRPVSLTGWAVGTGVAADIFGLVYIQSIDDTQSSISASGQGRRVEYSLELVGAGDAGGKPVSLFGF